MTGQHEPFALRGTEAAFVRMAAIDDDGGPIKLGLQELLVGAVANNVRHHAGGVGDHALYGDDGVTFDPSIFAHDNDDNRVAGGVMRRGRG